MRSSIVRPGLVIAAIALVAACGSSGSGKASSGSPSSSAMPSMDVSASPAAGPAAGGEPTVHIKDFQFSAPSAPITAGEKFLVVNDDSVPHTYETVKNGFESGTISAGGGQKEITAPAAGTYAIKCDFHANMHGTLTIT